MAGTATHESWTRSLNRVHVVRFDFADVNYATDGGLSTQYVWKSPMLVVGAGVFSYTAQNTITTGDGFWHIEALTDPDNAATDEAWINECRFWDHLVGFSDFEGSALSRFPLTAGTVRGSIYPFTGHQTTSYDQNALGAVGIPVYGLRVRFEGTTSVGLADFQLSFSAMG